MNLESNHTSFSRFEDQSPSRSASLRCKKHADVWTFPQSLDSFFQPIDDCCMQHVQYFHPQSPRPLRRALGCVLNPILRLVTRTVEVVTFAVETGFLVAVGLAGAGLDYYAVGAI